MSAVCSVFQLISAWSTAVKALFSYSCFLCCLSLLSAVCSFSSVGCIGNRQYLSLSTSLSVVGFLLFYCGQSFSAIGNRQSAIGSSSRFRFLEEVVYWQVGSYTWWYKSIGSKETSQIFISNKSIYKSIAYIYICRGKMPWLPGCGVAGRRVFFYRW